MEENKELFRDYPGSTATFAYDLDTVTVTLKTVCKPNESTEIHIFTKDNDLRLFGLNAPEVRGVERPEGLKARDWMREQIYDKELTIRTILDKHGHNKRGKYGRLLAFILIEIDGVLVDLNALAIEQGFAVFAEYDLRYLPDEAVLTHNKYIDYCLDRK